MKRRFPCPDCGEKNPVTAESCSSCGRSFDGLHIFYFKTWRDIRSWFFLQMILWILLCFFMINAGLYFSHTVVPEYAGIIRIAVNVFNLTVWLWFINKTTRQLALYTIDDHAISHVGYTGLAETVFFENAKLIRTGYGKNNQRPGIVKSGHKKIFLCSRLPDYEKLLGLLEARLQVVEEKPVNTRCGGIAGKPFTVQMRLSLKIVFLLSLTLILAAVCGFAMAYSGKAVLVLIPLLALPFALLDVPEKYCVDRDSIAVHYPLFRKQYPLNEIIAILPPSELCDNESTLKIFFPNKTLKLRTWQCSRDLGAIYQALVKLCSDSESVKESCQG